MYELAHERKIAPRGGCLLNVNGVRPKYKIKLKLVMGNPQESTRRKRDGKEQFFFEGERHG